MAVVLYTVQSRTWTNRMYVDAKFILPGSVNNGYVIFNFKFNATGLKKKN